MRKLPFDYPELTTYLEDHGMTESEGAKLREAVAQAHEHGSSIIPLHLVLALFGVARVMEMSR